MKELIEFDYFLFKAINGFGHPFLDPIMLFLSEKLVWIPLYILLIAFVINQTGRSFPIYLVGIIILITLTDQITSGLMKPFFERLRPCKDPVLSEFIVIVKGCGGKFGFASSHAANTFGLATFLFFLKRNPITYLLLIWALFVSYSRVYLGVHFPGDVIVGGLIGFMLGFTVLKVANITRSLIPFAT